MSKSSVCSRSYLEKSDSLKPRPLENKPRYT